MRKRFIGLLMAFTLANSILLSGCGNQTPEKAVVEAAAESENEDIEVSDDAKKFISLGDLYVYYTKDEMKEIRASIKREKAIKRMIRSRKEPQLGCHSRA